MRTWQRLELFLCGLPHLHRAGAHGGRDQASRPSRKPVLTPLDDLRPRTLFVRRHLTQHTGSSSWWSLRIGAPDATSGASSAYQDRWAQRLSAPPRQEGASAWKASRRAGWPCNCQRGRAGWVVLLGPLGLLVDGQWDRRP